MNYEHYIAGTQENNIIKHGDNHKTFALVNKYCKNAEQSAKGIWLYLIQQYKNDRRDETYYICKPIRCLAPEKTYVSEDMRHVLDLMTDDYGRDTDYTAARSHLIAERLEKNSGHSIREIRRDFLNGKVTYEADGAIHYLVADTVVIDGEVYVPGTINATSVTLNATGKLSVITSPDSLVTPYGG